MSERRTSPPAHGPPAVEDPLAARLHLQERRRELLDAYLLAVRAAERRHRRGGLLVEPAEIGLAAIEAAFDRTDRTDPAWRANPFGALVTTLGSGSSPAVRAELLREVRPLLVSIFSYAVPSDQALDRLAELGRDGGILELGAGGGYWASCLAARGVTVHAYDRTAPAAQKRKLGRLATHHPIRLGGPAEALREHPRCPTLLLCWPPGISNRAEVKNGALPRYSSMGEEALAGFRGENLVFVGARTASFGSPAFFSALDDGWQVREELALPNLGSWHDSLQILGRRRSAIFGPGTGK